MILSFVDREAELRLLEEAYKPSNFGFIILYGRRRVGKTGLIKQFIADKPHFYFLAKKKPLKEEMERFRLKFSETFNVFIPEAKNWDELMETIYKATEGKLIIVIDEFPYWIEKDSSILSDFQHLVDETLKNKNILLLLCGSYVSLMETDVLGYKSPLYGRRTGQIELNRLDFKNFSKFFPGWKLENIIKAYGALDGIPFYINEFDSGKNFLENIKNTFWKNGSVLNKEAEILLSEELREVEVYMGIMRSVFEGATKLGEIASKSHVEITNINKYLKVLLDLRFLSTEAPVVLDKPKRKSTIYKLTDNFLTFWFSYVYPFRDDIEIGETGRLEDFFEKDYDRYSGFIFEKAARQLLVDLTLPITPTKSGRQWGNIPKAEKGKNTYEIDLVCLEETKKEALFIECKWSDLKEKEARQVLEDLKEKAKFVGWERKKEYFGLMAKKISGKETLRKEGFWVWDLEDFGKALK